MLWINTPDLILTLARHAVSGPRARRFDHLQARSPAKSPATCLENNQRACPSSLLGKQDTTFSGDMSGRGVPFRGFLRERALFTYSARGRECRAIEILRGRMTA